MSTKTNNDFDPCLDGQELRAYASGSDTGVRDRSVVQSHLNVCDACRRRLDNVMERPDSLPDLVRNSVQIFRAKQNEICQAAQKGPVPGTIWRTKPNPDVKDDLVGALVIVLDSEHTPQGEFLHVAEVSEDLDQSIDSDILLLPQGSGMSLPTMVRPLNTFHMARRWIHSFAAQLPDQLWRQVHKLVREHENVRLDDLPIAADDPGFRSLRNAIEKREYLAADMTATRIQSELSEFGKDNRDGQVSPPVDMYKRISNLVSERPTSREKTWTEKIAPPGHEPGTAIRFISRRPEPVSRAKRDDRELATRPWLVGNSITSEIEVFADGYLVVFSYDETGTVNLTFPDEPDQITKVFSGDRKVITRQITGPAVKHGFKAFWTSRQLLDPTPIDFGTESVVEKAICQYFDNMEGLDSEEWQDAVFEYRVEELPEEGCDEARFSKVGVD